MTERRIVQETLLLEERLGPYNYRWEDKHSDHSVMKAVVETASKKVYVLILELMGYPELMPDMYVMGELKYKNGEPMSKTSYSMHCYGYCDGNTEICFGDSSEWSPQTSLFDLYIKGKIWLECYDGGHLVTGKPIDYYLRHPSQRNNNNNDV